jgi:NAD(P)-dependent dehydrogenase (short-subunit alcohol dehydrogenase family)
MSLVGRFCVVTDGCRGVGLQVTQALLSHGASVIAHQSSPLMKEDEENLRQTQTDYSQLVCVQVDLGSREGLH